MSDPSLVKTLNLPTVSYLFMRDGGKVTHAGNQSLIFQTSWDGR